MALQIKHSERFSNAIIDIRIWRSSMNKYIIVAISGLLVFLSSISLFAAEPRVVRVGAFNYYPAIFRDNDGVVKGFYVDALADIAQKENIRFEYVYGSWNEGLERIKSGEVDVLTSAAYTADRAKFLDYTVTPLLTVWGELYTPLSSGIDDIREVQGKKIAVMKGDFNAHNFIALVQKFHISCEFVELPGFDDVFKAVASGLADAGVVNNTYGVATQAEYGLRSTGIIFNPFDIFFAVAKDKNQPLLALLESNLANWRHQADSPYNKARNKWLHPKSTVIVTPNWVVPAIVACALLALVAVVFVVVLRKQVRRKTASIVESAEKYKGLSDRLDAILTAVPDILMEVDVNRVYTWANIAGIQFFGDAVVGTEAARYFAGEQDTYQKTQPLLDGSEQVIYLESWQRRKDGEIRLLGWWCKAVLDEEGRVTGGLSTARDITESKLAEDERVKLEGQLHQAQKMESIGRLAGGIAHDFNNMLSVILGHAEITLMRIDPNQPVYTSLKEISRAAERSADLTRQLLGFARKQPVAPEVIDLNESLAGLLSMLQRLIGENIQISWKPGSNLWSVMMDSSQIDQIMANLCVNARDAITDLGTISIATENCSIEDSNSNPSYVSPGDYVRILVSDTGPGMDEATLEHIFEPFFTTKGIGEGTGLGLATVYGIVKQNNGFINVWSEPGAGTTFTLYFPRHQGAVEQAVEKGVKLIQQGRETILLVEDEPAILEMTAMILTELGYNVLKAVTASDAIRMAREHGGEIDLLLSDVIMPEMNGRDLANNLHFSYPEMKRLFMSGYTADIISSHGVLYGGIHFIQKPFQLSVLAAKLREVLDER